MLETVDGMARSEETFRLVDTVHLLLLRTHVMSPDFQADVVTFMRRMLEQLAKVRRVEPSS